MKFSTAPTSDPAIEHFVQRFQDVLNADIEGDHDGDIKCVQLFALHKVLVRDPNLYTQVADALAERGILSRASLKNVITRAKEIGTN
jgi:hypothetical protein